jgi:hypothetical protein
MPIIEKLGSFFLGKEYDLAKKTLLPDRPINYDSRDLTTHAVCVGMTGSGKTGLCLCLLEEAALDGVPAILIDPKGDITNLLLTFPDLRPEDFQPWINADDARRKGQTVEEFAAKTAQTWRDGLASWEEGPERIRSLKAAADFAIYTPGSDAGLPISVISSFRNPKLDWETEAETLRERIQGTVSALLGLVGIEADPLRSREHILLSTIFEDAWRKGQDLDVAKLIMAVQKPAFKQIGIFDVETFFPEKERFVLAMALNNIIAAPSFASWMQGEPLDVGSLFHTAQGKPRHSIFYIAHLSDAERMFFVTILLNQVISWMRGQPGTTSLRGLVYMDEVFGFFPPTANPPSKKPMLTLLKQARAFGLGIMLTTQNPVDLDYKGLTNAGTWFIGKLQAERDKARLLEGLESAMAQAGTMTDTRVLDKTISSLESRVFLLHNVNQGAPVVFQTRWAMSYLRGPLTRQQIKTLMAGRKATEARPTAAGAVAAAATRPGAAPTVKTPAGLVSQPPVIPPGVKQVYLPVAVSANLTNRLVADRVGGPVSATGRQLIYEPALLGMATVRFTDRKLGVDEDRDFTLLLPLPEGTRLAAWRDAVALDLNPRDLADQAEEDVLFVADLPEAAGNAKALTAQASELADHLYRNQAFELAYNPTLKLHARAGENERDFKARCQQAARELRDAAVDKLRDKYEVKLKRLEERLAREQDELAEDKATYKGRMAEEALSGLSTVAGIFGVLGRRRGGLSGLSSAATKRRITSSAKADIAESEAQIARLQSDLDQIKQDMEDEANALTQQWATAVDDIQAVKVVPKKADIDVQMVALAWAPSWEVSYEDARGRARTETISAYPGAQEA